MNDTDRVVQIHGNSRDSTALLERFLFIDRIVWGLRLKVGQVLGCYKKVSFFYKFFCFVLIRFISFFSWSNQVELIGGYRRGLEGVTWLMGDKSL